MSGYLKLHRKIENSWQWQNPLWRSAWIWMLREARFHDCPESGLLRGQLWFSVNWSKDKWGMSPTHARRFLSQCVKEGDISWEKGTGGRRRNNCAQGAVYGAVSGGLSGADNGAVIGKITLLHYDYYNTKSDQDGADNGADNGALRNSALGAIPKKVPKKEPNTPLTPQEGEAKTRASRKARASHDPIYLQTQLSAINQADLFREFEPQGLDVKAWFDNFCDYVLNGSSKDPRPNPAGWVRFGQAAKDSARSAIQHGRFLRKGPSTNNNENAPRGGWASS